MCQASLFSKEPDILYSSGFAGHTEISTTTQFCYFSVKAARENIQMNDHGYVPIKLHL